MRGRAARDAGRWYEDGLSFGCTRCNGCCGGPPGYVWADQDEARRMASLLGVDVDEFDRLYCREALGRISLKEMPNGDCVFLGVNGCRVYPVRPEQCRTFPFWADNLTSARRWEGLKERCPGIGRGRRYEAGEIERIAGGTTGTGGP